MGKHDPIMRAPQEKEHSIGTLRYLAQHGTAQHDTCPHHYALNSP
jgi:hypothetical protein